MLDLWFLWYYFCACCEKFVSLERKYPMIARSLCLLVSVGLTLAFGDVLTTLNLSTGFNTNGDLITTDLGCDAHWTWGGSFNGDTNPDPNPCGVAAQVVMQTDPDWYPGGGQLPNSSGSEWIARDATTRHNGDDTYSVFFYLANDAGAVLSGQWSAEDLGAIYLNGHIIVESGANFSIFASTSACAPPAPKGCFYPDLQNGLNTLTISILESNDSWEGVRFQGTVTGIGASFVPPSDPPTPVPEPTYWGVLGVMAAAVCLSRRIAPSKFLER
jgi:hypothetical protein